MKRRHLLSNAASLAALAHLPGAALAQGRKDNLTLAMALEPPGLDPTAGAASDRWGRRGAFTVWAGLGALAFAALSSLMDAPEASLALTLTFGLCCFAFGVNGIIGAWTPELFPTAVRATGPGLCQNLGKGVGGLAGPIVAGRLLDAHGYSVVFLGPALLFALCAAWVWTFPRVDGRALDQE